MGRYEVRFKRSVSKDLRKLPARDIRRILARIDALCDEPRGPDCKQLTGVNIYRVRVGTYRIIYEIVDNQLLIQVIKVAHRSIVYR